MLRKWPGVLVMTVLFSLSWGIPSLVTAEEKKAAEDKKPEKRSGTVIGVITVKGENWVEVKADGEEKGRRYVPHWRGGLPKDGGGPDKEMVKVIRGLKVGSRVRLKWEFEERPRVIEVEVLKAASKDKDKQGP